MQSPADLKVFTESSSLADDVLKLLAGARVPNRFEDQLFGAVTSTPANLAEFCALNQKGSKMEKIQRCIAETNEVEYWLDLWLRHYGLSEEQHKKLREDNIRLRKQLVRLRQSIENS